MALFGFFLLIDGALMFSAGALSPRLVGFMVASYLLKLVACHLGGRRAALNEVAEPA